MLVGDNSKPSVLPRLRVPDAQLRLWILTSRASAVANAVPSFRKRFPNDGTPATAAANWTAIITRPSTFFWRGRRPRPHGVAEAPGFSRGVHFTKRSWGTRQPHKNHRR